jgi:hypothetical protein
MFGMSLKTIAVHAAIAVAAVAIVKRTPLNKWVGI